MKPPGHAAVSLGIGGAVWYFTRSPASLLAALLAGVLIDLDHLVEYYWYVVKGEKGKILLFLHS